MGGLVLRWAGSGHFGRLDKREVRSGRSPDSQAADHDYIGRSHWPLMGLGPGKSCMAFAGGCRAQAELASLEPHTLGRAGEHVAGWQAARLGCAVTKTPFAHGEAGLAGLADLLTDHTISDEGRNCAGHQRGSAVVMVVADAALGGILTLDVVPILGVGAECRSGFVSPCLDSSGLDTASACDGLVDPGHGFEVGGGGERTSMAWDNARRDVRFIL